MNCLSYALKFWNINNDYKIWYNSDHCINLPNDIINPFPNKEFLPIEEFGYDYFKNWYDERLINDFDFELLKLYFNGK